MNNKIRNELREKYNNMDPKNIFMAYYEVYDKRNIAYKTAPLIKEEEKLIDIDSNKEVDIYFIKYIKPIKNCFEDNKYRFVVKDSSLYLDIDDDQETRFYKFQQEAESQLKTKYEDTRKASK